MSHSIYLANKLNDYVLKGTAYPAPSNVYLALFTSSGGLDNNTEGSQDEISGNAYTRLTIDNSTLSFTASSAKASENNEDWLFPTATGNWGTISHVAIMDSLTSGNVLYWGQLGIATSVDTNDVFRFLAGELDSLYS